MSEQRGFIESSAAAEGAGAGQPPSGSDGQLADSCSQQQPAAVFSAHSAAAATADAAMTDVDVGSAAVVSPPAAAAAQPAPLLQPLTHGQPQGQPDQLDVDSAAIDEVIEEMVLVPTQPAHEFVLRQRRLMNRLRRLIGCSSDRSSWLRASSVLSVGPATAVIQMALRVDAVSERADELVSDCGRSPRINSRTIVNGKSISQI
jgi:hypothetical protein